MIKVKNLNGTYDNKVPAGYSSWLDFWEKKSGKRAEKCGRNGCIKKATDGAHVQKADSNDNRWYIVPLCHECNMKPSSEEFYVNEILVPVRD